MRPVDGWEGEVSADQQRIAIAEACVMYGIYKGSGRAGYYGKWPGNHRVHAVPDYQNSIDVIRAAVATLYPFQQAAMNAALHFAAGYSACYVHQLTPFHWCECFLIAHKSIQTTT